MLRRCRWAQNASKVPSPLLGRAVVACSLLEFLDISRRPVYFQRELVKLTSELERHLIIIGNRRARIRADIEVLVPLHDERDSVLHGLTHYFLVVDFEHAGAAAADSAHAIE